MATKVRPAEKSLSPSSTNLSRYQTQEMKRIGLLAVPAWKLDTTPPTTYNSGQFEWQGQFITMNDNGIPGDEVVRERLFGNYMSLASMLNY
jgi:hypothetical protein